MYTLGEIPLKLEDQCISPKVWNLSEFGIPSLLCFLIMFPTISDPMTTQITLNPDFIFAKCCQLVANLLPICCQFVANCCQFVANLATIGNKIGNKLATSWQQQKVWFYKEIGNLIQKMYVIIYCWGLGAATHISATPGDDVKLVFQHAWHSSMLWPTCVQNLRFWVPRTQL